MNYQQILLDVSNRVATITLNRPEKLNAMTYVMKGELTDAFEGLQGNKDVSVIIVRGAGRSFCAGHDLNEAGKVYEGYGQKSYALEMETFRERRRGADGLNFLTRMLRETPQPIIAQVRGYALVVGLELAMNCDIVIADTDAKFGCRPIGGAGRFYHLWPWLIGLRKSMELLLTGEYISAAEAADIGMINRAVAPDQLDDEVRSLAERMARVPLEYLTLNKQGVWKMYDMMGMRQGMEYSMELHAISHLAPQSHELVEKLKEGGMRMGVAFRDQFYRKESKK